MQDVSPTKRAAYFSRQQPTSPMISNLILSGIVLVLCAYILRTEMWKNWRIESKKALACSLRDELQELIDEFKGMIEIVIPGDPSERKRSVNAIWFWFENHVGIKPQLTISDEKKPVRILVDGITDVKSNMVKVVIEWPGMPFEEDFLSVARSHRDCDMSMRVYCMRNLKRILTKMKNVKMVTTAIANGARP